MADLPHRCEAPFFPDVGQAEMPTAYQKLLVTGGDKARQGTYPSWNSAGGNSQRVSGALVVKYEASERHLMHTTWYSACDRGEHYHPGKPQTSATPPSPGTSRSAAQSSMSRSSTPRTAGPSSSTLYTAGPSFRLWTPTPSPAPQASAETPQRQGKSKFKLFREGERSPSPPPTLAPSASGASIPAPGFPAYAVRSGTRGWIFGDAGAARDKFHRLQTEGLAVELATTKGFTQALRFVERDEDDMASAEGRVRREWIREEREAYRRRAAAEAERAARCETVLEELAYYREGESIHGSDESDASRGTEDLEGELELRVAHGAEWRERRSAPGRRRK
ncbi:hypothetical protein B0H16DRAFT_1745043 [Mycena metata]|uniref:Uncharacterized protein n=1 Tax=Mycena metata TaxID=1033252 RepID=A0AAD7H4C1_9AGAR|nr:hypothetical protein B0H16DRAFT_1745043 [Mycena metata]